MWNGKRWLRDLTHQMCWAVWDHWCIQYKWWLDANISAKELLPIVLVCAVWGRQWCHQRVLDRGDNMAVMAVCLLMHLLHCLHAYSELDMHIGCENIVADAVSCNILWVIHV